MNVTQRRKGGNICALEKTLDQYWARILSEAALCPMRPQLLLPPSYAGADTAEALVAFRAAHAVSV